jgi:tRNA-2-methylthio-N6-dimethylallyladenosine synthase
MVDDFVAPEVAAERMGRLTELVEASALRRHEARAGLVEEVLVEGPSKRDPEVVAARTRQSKLVHFPAPEGVVLAPGTYAEARITRGAPHWLQGEFGRVTEPARRRRVRIPVAAG